MKQSFKRTVLTLCAALVAGILSYPGYSLAQADIFQLNSASLTTDGSFADEQIASGFGCSGGNLSPELSWTGAPEGTKSFGLNMYDPDAPTGSGFWHWVVFNIPADATSLSKGAGDPSVNLAPEGTIQAHNDAGFSGYLGPCPPEGTPHHYVITLFALGIDTIPLDDTASGALAGFYLNGNALGKATLTVDYGRASSFQLTSPTVAANADGSFADEQIANGFGCSGGNLSPELTWTGAPEGTKSFGLNMYDPDAPTGSGFWHWVVFNIPADATSLPAGAGDPTAALAAEGTIQAHNDAGFSGYLGPCPPEGAPHHYVVTLYALSIDSIPLDDTASGALTGFYLNANALGKATFTIDYGR
ncbi:MAG TPA: YbhB/YbcL family Raf kinase inhibitor-like protein [Phototrophicaceae bacterium]|jgi:Raf kinase inhibitor-like YbhB/YbcL family protein|nr:YbhB/YbcL family Raf kinase inhibitor-like protein [Phototrophicaceae bacterium]